MEYTIPSVRIDVPPSFRKLLNNVLSQYLEIAPKVGSEGRINNNPHFLGGGRGDQND